MRPPATLERVAAQFVPPQSPCNDGIVSQSSLKIKNKQRTFGRASNLFWLSGLISGYLTAALTPSNIAFRAALSSLPVACGQAAFWTMIRCWSLKVVTDWPKMPTAS
jgi:hypothetical protein